ncbi:autotransporter-associated beta strand repeat-containing protein [Lacunisphaera limnophila]|nr:autotransporter-associated beta strand repeat-containing protein [Lacunisphaera limnophila]
MKRLSLFMLACLAGASALAQTTYTWTGFGTDGLFSNPANWQGGLVPTGNATDRIVIPANPRPFIYFSAPVSVGDITFSGIQNGQYLQAQPETSPSITLHGNVSTTPGSTYWGLFSVPVILAAGNHTYDAGGAADLYHFAALSGSGGITKTGARGLILTETSTYTGGTIINQGTVYAGADNALGTGPVTLNSNGGLSTAYLDGAGYPYVTLSNNFLLGATARFGDFFYQTGPLVLTGTVAPVTGVTAVTVQQAGSQPLAFEGALTDGAAPTSYSFTGGRFYLGGTNTYTGGTVVDDDSQLIFRTAASVPTTGLIKLGGYVGLQDNTMSATTFVSRFNPAFFGGIIGFDDDGAFTGDIDLSAFYDPTNTRLGTLSERAILTGQITPYGNYKFEGSGQLRLQGTHPLTGSAGLDVATLPDSAPLLLVLGQSAANNYSGQTYAVNAGVIFDSAGALSANTTLHPDIAGYFGFTDNSGLSASTLISQLNVGGNIGILGFDASAELNFTTSTPFEYESNVNLGTLSSANGVVFLGSASHAKLTGSLTTQDAGAANYFFTGYRGGSLEVASLLEGNRSVQVGLPSFYPLEQGEITGQVILSNPANTYSGGTELVSGVLTVSNDAALGTGGLTISSGSSPVTLQTGASFTKNILLASGILELSPLSIPTNVSGILSGPGSLAAANPLMLSGANTFSGGVQFKWTEFTVAHNTALGTGGVVLEDGADLIFTTTAPVMGSLLLGTANYDEGTDNSGLYFSAGGSPVVLTINQTEDAYYDGALIENGSVGSLVKTGPAALTIYGSRGFYDTPYTGGTTILAGKLIAGNADALGTGPITLNGGELAASPGVTISNALTLLSGRLGGNGTFAGPISVGTGVTLAPGESPGTLTFAAGLTLGPGARSTSRCNSPPARRALVTTPCWSPAAPSR